MTPAEGDAFLTSPMKPNSPEISALRKPRNGPSVAARLCQSAVCANQGAISFRLYATISPRRLIALKSSTERMDENRVVGFRICQIAGVNVNMNDLALTPPREGAPTSWHPLSFSIFLSNVR